MSNLTWITEDSTREVERRSSSDQTHGGASIWLIVGSALFLACAYVIGVALDSTGDDRADIVSTEVWALATLLIFAVPIAVIRARSSPQTGAKLLVFTIVIGFAIDGLLALYMNIRSATVIGGTDFMPFMIGLAIMFGGPFKVLVAEAIVLIAASLRKLVR